MKFGLSPYPRLVLVVEGKTEMVLLANVMDYLGIPRRPSHIELLDMGGTDDQRSQPNQKVYLLAGYVAGLRLGELIQPGLARLERALTQVMVVADPENSMATQRKRDLFKQQLIEAIYARLPEQYQSPQIKSKLEGLVTLVVWSDGKNEQPFEFAHFTPEELAEGIKAACRNLGRAVPTVTAGQVGKMQDFNAERKRLKLSKTEIAKALWPTLRQHLEDHARLDTLEEIPVVKLLEEANKLTPWGYRASAFHI